MRKPQYCATRVRVMKCDHAVQLCTCCICGCTVHTVHRNIGAQDKAHFADQTGKTHCTSVLQVDTFKCSQCSLNRALSCAYPWSCYTFGACMPRTSSDQKGSESDKNAALPTQKFVLKNLAFLHRLRKLCSFIQKFLCSKQTQVRCLKGRVRPLGSRV